VARRWKEKHPVSYYYHKLRTSARRRGKAFSLSRKRFEELWLSGLAQNHGRTAMSLSIDRINDKRGYHDDNVRLLTLSFNSRRRFVPFFDQQDVAETSQKIKESYGMEATP